VFDHLKKRSADINYGTLALEILVVMAGILIAFQIDRWGEERRERAQESRIGLDLNLQHLFDRLTAGILTTSELTKVEEFAGQGKLQDVSPSRALEIAQEFAARQEAVRILPNIAQYHVFNQKITESYRRQALVIIEQIKSLLEENES
jgi:hypothetical protein